ncbi:N-acetylneuraminate synthase [Providencia rettgeri]|uniref:N-acetylneuraminate synthase n=1 Tax=Providencia TaxID=586 RepID=UPI0018E4AAB9|nr:MULTISPECIES: N-acetylneuraminate synthase [Providencia]EJD6477305.1 N-acetylneuraminate synthase [Providencia rettgeri]ELR5065672.1 N-acetylneuraminate synthase [Providencia rettgeri]ELR5166200.1 N-acetylneuraminate synthase [Providencia rettgeri]MBI6194342.1 N-acetylneuraminate synthase [Providencia rettgeri]MBQ0342505.1 N-acetylneuraminate synthase [Providencia rettgeri]
MNDNVFIIAEAGVNHNGNFELAKKLIDAAVDAGVDAVKFQTWKTELLVTEDAQMAEYQIENTKVKETQFEMLKRLELSYEDFTELKEYCVEKNIIFMSTPDEEQSANFLNNLQDIFKIGSGELTNTPFLRHIANFGKPVILSTGMGYLSEVEHAIFTLLDAGLLIQQITVLHATTDYPTSPEDVNLLAMTTIKNAFPGITVGYSDHTLGIEIPIAAVALGAKVIEKHFTLDKNMDGPDHKASLEPTELSNMVKAIRNIEQALGTGWKVPTKTEKLNRDVVRKSIIAKKAIPLGTPITEDMLEIKRPGNGIPPTRWDEVIGSIAKKNYQTGELI